MLSKFKSNVKSFLVFLILAVTFYLYIVYIRFAILKFIIPFMTESDGKTYVLGVYNTFREGGIHRFVGSGDAMSQYVHFAEYFRTLFYDTWHLFPQYAPHLAGGQNIFNFSYYGLYNPIYMFSFLLPFVSMITYIEITSVLALAVSGFLVFKVLKTHKFSSAVCYIVGICFMASASITSQTYTNFMFVNYIPFLLLAMIGTKQHIEKNKSLLLIFSVTTLILMSYYFALPSLITLSIYALFCYFDWHSKIEIKKIVNDGFLYISRLAISVLMSAILLLPTAHQILVSRVESINRIDLKLLLDFKVNLALLVYSPYAMGFSVLAVTALVYNLLFEKRLAYKIVCLAVLLLVSFPLFTYLMNGGTSLHGKVFIPFGVLITLLIANLIKSAMDNEKFIGKTSMGIVVSIVLVTLIIGLADVNLVLNKVKIVDMCVTSMILMMILWMGNKKWVERVGYLLAVVALANGLLAQNTFNTYSGTLYSQYFGDEIQNEIETVLEDEEGLYRFTYLLGSKYFSCNKIFGDQFYRTSLHSSLYNKEFLDFRNHILDVEQSSGAHSNDYDTEDLMYNMYMGNKYMVKNDDNTLGYERVSTNIYKNDDILPIGYVNNKIIALSDFNEMGSFEKKEAILKYVVVEDGHSSTITSEIETLQFEDFELKSVDENIIYDPVENGINIKSTGETQLLLTSKLDLEGKVLLVSFDKQNDSPGMIGINGIYNRIMPRSYVYYIDNTSFSYVIGKDKLDEITIDFAEGYYELRNIRISTIDYKHLKGYVQGVDPFDVNMKRTKGNRIIGSIDTEGGYFVLNTPYDKGFHIEVDGEAMAYEKVNYAFVGFPLDKGHHSIKIVYRAPWFRLGAIISALTIMCLMVASVYKKRKKR